MAEANLIFRTNPTPEDLENTKGAVRGLEGKSAIVAQKGSPTLQIGEVVVYGLRKYVNENVFGIRDKITEKITTIKYENVSEVWQC